ncbi:MAG: preprotein translocase subunit SecA [Acidobacteria bacterium]|nr:preprotein translocase subunit SecA [Acidobacteriota bacterium]
MVGNLLTKVFGTQNDRDLKRLAPLVSRISALEPAMQALPDDGLRQHTATFRARVAGGEALDDVLPDAFALVREAGRRVLHMRHYDVQLIGGIVLHQGRIGEMKTGEGKTLMATLPAYLNALSGKGVHVVTVNDYLARRDAEWMGRIYRFLGLTVGVIQHDLNDDQRQAAYGCDITYGTNNEFGFDYLRDNMKFDLSRMVQRAHNFAIVDEVDSILIDEARTPLIISGPAEESNDLYYEVDRIIPSLTRGLVHQGQVKTEDRERMEASGDYTVDEKGKTVTLTEAGIAKAESLLAHRLQPGGLYDPINMPLLHHVQQGLRAHTHYRLDVEYMIKDGQVVIVDEFTGRLMPGRRWSDGLHQAVEAKEGVKIERENQTLATITFQNYFRKYAKLSGMTGTAETEAPEFNKIYKLDVMVIPTNKPLRRLEEPDLVYRTAAEKYEAIVTDIIEKQQVGRPVLVGTVSIEKSEKISAMLKRRGIKHVVLNAKYHAQEAEIVAQAGRKHAVTIATNMAGRGTDILLGGSPEHMARQQCLHEEVAEKLDKGEERFVDDDAWVYFSHGDNYRVPRADWDRIFTHFKAQCEAEHDDVVAIGGLHILGTERHESRRIDNQLRGRAGRQGDPGSSRFYLSLEDDLMRIFGSDRISGLMQRLGMEEGVPIEAGMVSRAIERAQKQVEAQNFAVRKHLLEYDDVMNKQRESVYTLRREVLDGTVRVTEDETSDTRGYLLATADDLVDDKVELYCPKDGDHSTWDLDALRRELTELFSLDDDDYAVVPFDGRPAEICEALSARVRAKYEVKEAVIPADIMRRVERDLMLQIVDTQWKDHLYSLDHLKDGISLRSYGQRDPLVEYKKESYVLFQDMRSRIEAEMVRYLWWLRPVEGGPDGDQPIVNVPARPAARKPAPLIYSGPSDVPSSGFPPPAAPSGGFPPPGGPRPARVGGDDAPITTVKHAEPKIGRNDPCWCGSGKKFKKCHGAN